MQQARISARPPNRVSMEASSERASVLGPEHSPVRRQRRVPEAGQSPPCPCLDGFSEAASSPGAASRPTRARQAGGKAAAGLFFARPPRPPSVRFLILAKRDRRNPLPMAARAFRQAVAPIAICRMRRHTHSGWRRKAPESQRRVSFVEPDLDEQQSSRRMAGCFYISPRRGALACAVSAHIPPPPANGDDALS
jgi:hypothetical protein